MKFGIHNPSWLFGSDPAEIFEAVKTKAQWAENHGFTWFSVMDHLIQIGNVGAPDEPFMEGWTVLTALAAVTSRIRLATLVSSVHYRNPAHLAKIAAGVDQISRGRLTFGIGAGWFETEYRQYGWEFPPRPAVRIRQMEEAVRLIMSMWTEKRTTFQGKYFQAQDAILEPKPIQKPHPPIMIGGGGEQLTLRAVARQRMPATSAARPTRSGTSTRCCTAIARRRAETTMRSSAPTSSASSSRATRRRSPPSGRSLPFRRTTTASPARSSQITDLVGRYQDAGVQLFISSAYKNDAETLELLAADVMPKFAS